jgi:hypothetical protein
MIPEVYLTPAKKNSVRAEGLRQSLQRHLFSIPRITLHIALQLLFHQFFSLCRSPILNKHSGIGANCDHMSEWVHWVPACIWNAMGDVAKISPCVPSTCAQNAILSAPIIQKFPSRQIYVAINNRSLVLSISCLTTNSYLWNSVHAADAVSDAENLQSNGCRCMSQLYKFRHGIQVTRVFSYCGERQA